MKIKNYTSGVPISQSLATIEAILVEAGATHVAKFYDENREISGFLFQMIVEGKPITFKLPVNVDGVYNSLIASIKRPKANSHVAARQQAQRTAWKLLHEWVHIQLSMIQMKQVEAVQVFLPYAYNGKMTFFESMKEKGFRMLTQQSAKEG